MVDPSPLRISSTHSGQTASTAHLRALEERLATLEEQLRSSAGGRTSSSTPALIREQRHDLNRLGRNASGGPSAPPPTKRQPYAMLHRHFRRLVYIGYGGPRHAGYIVSQPYPGRGSWPRHAPLNSTGEPGPSDSRTAEEDLASGNQIRLHLGRPHHDPVNASQLRPIFRYMLAHRSRCGVPTDMTMEQLVSICSSTFTGWATEYQRSLTPSGRRLKTMAKARSLNRARRVRKASARKVALRSDRYYFFCDGAKVLKTQGDAEETRRVRQGAVRADVEFAIQTGVMSDEEDEWAPYEGAADRPDEDDPSDSDGMEGSGSGHNVRRRVAIPWRSACLIQKLEKLDKQRKRQPLKPVLRPKRMQPLPPGFVLPSTIRRWMVARSWAEQNEEACVDVSDNAGPFRGKYSVTKDAKDWGEDPDWSQFVSDANLDGDGSEGELPDIGASSSRLRRELILEEEMAGGGEGRDSDDE